MLAGYIMLLYYTNDQKKFFYNSQNLLILLIKISTCIELIIKIIATLGT
mgnify:CR=1 FL=1